MEGNLYQSMKLRLRGLESRGDGSKKSPFSEDEVRWIMYAVYFLFSLVALLVNAGELADVDWNCGEWQLGLIGAC